MPNQPYSIFDGYNLTLHRADGSVVDAWPAISGNPGHQRPSEQRKSDLGPVPEGNYSFPLGNVQKLDQWNQVLGYVGRGGWRGGVRAWGTQRAELVPADSSNLFGRSGFFIHGGFQPGSRGCIDLGPNEDAYFSAVRALGGKAHEVIVQYDPRLETEAHPLATHSSFDVRDYFSRPLLRDWLPQGDVHVSDEGAADSATAGASSAPIARPARTDQFKRPTSAAQGDQGDIPAGRQTVPDATQQLLPAAGVPPNPLAVGNYLAVGGVPVTHRSMYLASIYGPQRVVDAINNGQIASLPAALPDDQTQRRIRSWVQGWHGIGPMVAPENAALASGDMSGTADDGPDDWIVPSDGQQM